MKDGAQNQARGRCRQPLCPTVKRPREHQHLSPVHSGSLQNLGPNTSRCRWGRFGKDFGLKASLKSLDHAPEIRIASKLDLEELPIVGEVRAAIGRWRSIAVRAGMADAALGAYADCFGSR